MVQRIGHARLPAQAVVGIGGDVLVGIGLGEQVPVFKPFLCHILPKRP
jgi:hypothetical protein